MRDHWISFVGARGNQHGRPKRFHLVQMRSPLDANDASKNWAQYLILANPAIKGVEDVDDRAIRADESFVDQDIGFAPGSSDHLRRQFPKRFECAGYDGQF